MTEKEKANSPEKTTETQTDDKTKPPKKKMKLWKKFLILMAIISVIVYLTTDERDAIVHNMKLEGAAVVSDYRFSDDVNASDWGYVYNSVARATVSTMEEILADDKFKGAKEVNLRFHILGIDKYGKEGTFMIAEFHIPMAEWKKYSTKITGDWLLIAPILKQFYYRGDSRFEKNLRNQKEYLS